ncbi:MAG: EthD domain-containing protein [Proteobacteria bacterium]|nr:EthD domain-containing protein [Pseudomonadota bacterium]
MNEIADTHADQSPLKLIGLLHRRPDLSLAQFSDHWRTIHRDVSLRLIAPGLMLGYLQNHRIEDGEIAGLPLAADGLPELWTLGTDVLQRLGTAPEYLEGAYPDEPNFMDGRSQALLAKEQVITVGIGRAVATTLVKAMLFYRRAPGVSRAAFAAENSATHPLLLPNGPEPMRLTRHTAIELPDLGEAGAAYEGTQPYDGIEASYWPDADSFRAAWSQRSDDAAGFIDVSSLVGVLVREEPVLWPKAMWAPRNQ